MFIFLILPLNFPHHRPPHPVSHLFASQVREWLEDKEALSRMSAAAAAAAKPRATIDIAARLLSLARAG